MDDKIRNQQYDPYSFSGSDEEYSDTARYKGSNDGGYDYGYDYGYIPANQPVGESDYKQEAYGPHNPDLYGAPNPNALNGQNPNMYGGQPPYNCQNPNMYGGQNPPPYNGQVKSPFVGAPYRYNYREPKQQQYLEDENNARNSMILGIISLVCGLIGGLASIFYGTILLGAVMICPIIGICLAVRTIQKDKELPLAYVGLVLNCVATLPFLAIGTIWVIAKVLHYII